MLGNHENRLLMRRPCLAFLKLLTDIPMATLPPEPLPVLVPQATEKKHKVKTKKRKLDPWETR